MNTSPKPGTVAWVDLTTPEADKLRDFYSAVVGWRHAPVDMGGYDDFNMLAPHDQSPVAGVCHKRGANADVPTQWMVYINVADLDASMQACREQGGEILLGPKGGGGFGRWCVIRDPAMAVCALIETVVKGEETGAP